MANSGFYIFDSVNMTINLFQFVTVVTHEFVDKFIFYSMVSCLSCNSAEDFFSCVSGVYLFVCYFS